jgi:hypothetical protein
MPRNTTPRTKSAPMSKEEARVRANLVAEAMRELRDRYRTPYELIVKEKFAAAGLEYRPRLTDAEKAERQVLDLLAKFPEIGQKVTKVVLDDLDDRTADGIPTPQEA